MIPIIAGFSTVKDTLSTAVFWPKVLVSFSMLSTSDASLGRATA
jgi:hypothetical protein